MLNQKSVKVVRMVKGVYFVSIFFVMLGGVSFPIYGSSKNFDSLNINEARESRKRAQLFEMTEKIYVLFKQETHSDLSNTSDWVMEFDELSVSVILSFKSFYVSEQWGFYFVFEKFYICIIQSQGNN